MTKKEIAIAFLKMAASGDIETAYRQYISPNFIHHNQYFRGDRQSFMTAMIDSHKAEPNKNFEVKRAVAEGDMVVTYSRVVRQDADAAEIAVVHMVRFEGDKIAELWDVGQLIDKNSPNENGAF